MHPALVTLMKLQANAAVRRLLRQARTPKGAAFFVLGAVVLVLWIVPAAAGAFLAPRAAPEGVRAAFPVIVMGVTLLNALTSAGDRAVAFTPAEINFLFPGPFARREVLLYKLAKGAAAALLSSVVLSVILLRFATSWPASFAAVLLSLMFLQLGSMAVVLAAHTLGRAAAGAWWRRAALGALLIAAGVALAPAARAAMRMEWAQVVPAIEASRAARVVFSPVIPHAMALTAPRLAPDLLAWGAAALLVDALLLGVVLWLDVNYLEVSLAASRRQTDRLERVRRGQAFLPKSGARAPRLRVPALPRLGGAGPVAWRQLTTALRTFRGLLLFLLILSSAVLPALLVGRRATTPQAVLPVVAWVTFIVGSMLKFDFRGDLDQMDVMKSLPARPVALAAGQLAAPVLVMTLFHALLLGAAAVKVGPGAQRAVFVWAAVLAAPFNLLLFGVENALFLLYPTRAVAATPGDLGAMGRQVVLFFVKTIVLLTAAALATGPAVAAYFLAGRSVTAAAVTAFAALAVLGVALVPVVGWAFRRYDPGVDTPA